MAIFSIVARRADLIAYQQRSFAQCVPDHEFVVVNNGPNYEQICQECHLRGVPCHNVPSRGEKDFSRHHAMALNYAWCELAEPVGGNLLMCDMDVFPLAPIDIDRVLGGAQLAGVRQDRGTAVYLWPGLLLVSKDLPDRSTLSFDPGTYCGTACDTGGAMHEFLTRHENVRVKFLTERPVVADDLPSDLRSGVDCDLLWHLVDERFLHLVAGSNWLQLPSYLADKRIRFAKEWLDKSACDAFMSVTADHIITPDAAAGAIKNNEFPGFLDDYLLLHCLLRHCNPQNVMEIGTQWGIGTQIIKNAVPEATVFSLDLPPELAGLSTYFVRDVGIRCQLPFIQLRGDSRAFDFAPYRPVDAWFIDGEHTYEHVFHESSEAYKADAKLIVWHDCDIPDVWHAVQDSRNPDYDLYRVVDSRIGYAVRKP
jgi:hypothetical protein